jgi:hypothetical protein
MPLLGGLPPPLDGLPRVLAHALTALVAHTEVELRASVVLLGGLAVPQRRLLDGGS